tara:strand:+ start:160 stop:1152 length:993 start_codon:yes stop_codon:yes gene_type:complete
MSDFDNMELSEDTEMGDALTSAFDQHDENIAEEVVAAPAETIAPVQTGLAGMSDEVPAPVPETEEAPAKSNAPQSWGVAEREAWGGIPENVQAQIQKRESEIQQALTNSGEARNLANDFQKTIAPYQGLMTSNNAHPMETVNQALQSYAGLVSGTPQTKAQVVVDAIKNFGIDIHMLDSMLSGEEIAEPVNPTLQAVQQEMAPFNQFMQQQQQQQEYQKQQQYQSNEAELNAFFQNNEFAGDVSGDMSKIMEVYGNMPLSEAYDRAIQGRPDIVQVLEQRKAAQAAQNNNQKVQWKQNAASSIPQGQAMQSGAPVANTMREALENAMTGN